MVWASCHTASLPRPSAATSAVRNDGLVPTDGGALDPASGEPARSVRELHGSAVRLDVIDRFDEGTSSYLRESPYTFEGEVEFLQEAARYAHRRGWARYARWLIYLAAVALGIGLVGAGLKAVL